MAAEFLLFLSHDSREAMDDSNPAIFLYYADDELKLVSAPFKASQMGRSRGYAVRKHGVLEATHRVVASSLEKMAIPLTLLSARRRAKQAAF